MAPLTIVNVLKPRWEEDEDERAKYVLSTLKPHFERAIGLYWQLAEERLRHSMALDGLDGLRIGVVMLDKAGLVMMANRSAEAMLAANDGLSLSNRRLAARNKADAAALEALIGGTATEVRRIDQGGTIAVRRPSGARPFIVTIVPAQEGSPAHRFGASLLFIKDPDDAPLPDTSQLRRLFGLSPAEAKLCAALAAGTTMQEFADAAGITANTAKTHLRGAFAKTETSRQADLIRLILASLPAARPVNGT